MSPKALRVNPPNTTATTLDMNDAKALEAAVATYNFIILLTPYTYHATVIEVAIGGKASVIATSYISPA